MDILLAAVTQAVFDYLLAEAGIAEKVRTLLKREPQQLAFKIALARAYTTFALRHRDWAEAFFDETFLRGPAVPVLATILTRDGQLDAVALARAYADHTGLTGAACEQRIVEVAPIAADFLSNLESELRACAEFRALFDSRALEKIADVAEEAAQEMRKLREELLQALKLAERAKYWIRMGLAQGVVIGDNASATNVFGDIVFRLFEQAPLSRYIRVSAFENLVRERTREFVGRSFIFEAIDNHLRDPDFPSGYIVISGEPGIGKTALLGQLVKQTGAVHHFNIATQNIRSTQTFLSNICAQLIVRYRLPHITLPPEATQDSGFLSSLLNEAAERTPDEPVVILIDALDEAEDESLPRGTNRLYLPQTLPDKVFFIVTSREIHNYRLVVDRRRDIYLSDNDPQNTEDVHQYTRRFTRTHQVKMAPQIARWGVEEDEFVNILTEKSLGNFMYLVYVLRDIRDSKLTADNIDNIHNLPRGLQDYYKRHWEIMRSKDLDQFRQYYQPVVCILAVVREPVTVAQVAEWTQLDRADARRVIREWREFLNEDGSQQGDPLYRIYHTSFQEFLQDEVGLSPYHGMIVQMALNKIPGFQQ
jgi:AAA ATPase domain